MERSAESAHWSGAAVVALRNQRSSGPTRTLPPICMEAQTSRSAVRAALNRLICVPLGLMAVLGVHSHAE